MGSKISYIDAIGTTVKNERTKKKMKQIEFYNFLFPNNGLDLKNTKSKMHDIEKGERKTIDPDLLYALHNKCNLGMDYIFGYETVFPNHENENACKYTGLSVETIELLHELAEAQRACVPPLVPDMSNEEFSKRCEILDKKQEAEWILNIIEMLLTEDIDNENESYPNYNILFDLYMLSVAKPEKIYGITRDYTDEDELCIKQILSKSKELYIDSLSMRDSFGVGHVLDIYKIHQQIWKEKLNTDIDRFISMVQNHIVNKQSNN